MASIYQRLHARGLNSAKDIPVLNSKTATRAITIKGRGFETTIILARDPRLREYTLEDLVALSAELALREGRVVEAEATVLPDREGGRVR